MSIIKIYSPFKGRFVLQACDRNILAIGNLLAYNIGMAADFFRAMLTCTTEETVTLETCTVYLKPDKVIIENNNDVGSFVIISRDYAMQLLDIWEAFIFGTGRTLVLRIDMGAVKYITATPVPERVFTAS